MARKKVFKPSLLPLSFDGLKNRPTPKCGRSPRPSCGRSPDRATRPDRRSPPTARKGARCASAITLAGRQCHPTLRRGRSPDPKLWPASRCCGRSPDRATYAYAWLVGLTISSGICARAGRQATITAAPATSSGCRILARCSALTGTGRFSRMGVSTSPG